MTPKLYWLPTSQPGRLAISARPRGGDWLEDEVEGWHNQTINIVVSLLTEAENKELDLKEEAKIAKQHGLELYSFPIEDRSVPLSLDAADRLVALLSSALRAGKNIAIHCRQGIGRSSLISAALLIAGGEDPDHAVNMIQKVRGVEVPETAEQHAWLKQFARIHAADFARQNH